jgi:hypothetical protein
MRNFLAFLAAAVIVLAGAGWYLDWFKVSSQPNGEGHRNITVDVDTQKVGSDVSTAVKKGEQILDKDKSTEAKSDAKGGVEVQVDNNGVELKTPKISVTLPQPPGH